MKYRISFDIDVEEDEAEYFNSTEELEAELKRSGLDFPPALLQLSKKVAETVKVYNVTDIDIFRLSEQQVRVIEAALRFSLDLAREDQAKVLDYGDGANKYFSPQAYIAEGDITVDEEKIVAETIDLLDDALTALQTQRS